MPSRTWLGFGAAFVCLAASLAAQEPSAPAAAGPPPSAAKDPIEGITSSMEMPGMPMPPARPITHCIKPDEIKDNQSFADSMLARNKGKCKISDVKFEGDKLSYSFACDGGASGTSEIVFGGTTYEGTTKMTVPGHGNGPMTMTNHFKAKRVGDC